MDEIKLQKIIRQREASKKYYDKIKHTKRDIINMKQKERAHKIAFSQFGENRQRGRPKKLIIEDEKQPIKKQIGRPPKQIL